MNMKFATLIAASVAVVGSANAVTIDFNFQSNGTYNLVGNTATASDTNLTQYITGSTPGYTFVNLAYSYDNNFAGVSKTGTVTNGNGVLTLKNPSNVVGTYNFTFAGDAKRTFGNSLAVVSFSNLTFNLTGATGFAVGTSGSGTFSANKTFGLSSTTFVSNIQAVPEPASMAALAIGGLGLLRRRRKA